MNNTVLLIKEWTDYQEKYPEATIESFCEAYLSSKNLTESAIDENTGKQDFKTTYALSKVINRLSKLWMYFTLQAIKPMGLTSFDEFVFLFTLNQNPSMRKKDLIYTHFIEISSGLLVIDRLIKKGFLAEKTNNQDKRSKQVSMTLKGKKTFTECQNALRIVAKDLYEDMPEDQMTECLQYLVPLELKISQKWNLIKKFKPMDF